MSDETESSPEISPKSPAETTPRARKAATPRPKKVAKSATPVKEDVVAVVSEAPMAPPPAESSAPSGGEWPEPEAASTGGVPGQSESGKRKRRRRKGKGQGPSAPNTGGPPNDEAPSNGIAEPRPAEAPREQGPRPNPQPQQPQQQPRPKIDPEHLAKMAWKIYLAEVSEEGVALIGDNDAKDLSRRCFRLAEIFIEEQSRRR
ncbi:MAG: hypothetical protein V4689_02405 [Verrucomicrobiota bacterium]